MNLYLFDDKNVVSFSLTTKIVGNYWMTDSNDKNIINIDAQNDEWIISGNDETKIYFNNSVFSSISLKKNAYYFIEKEGKTYILLATNLVNDTFKTYKIIENYQVKISNSQDTTIFVNIPNTNNYKILLSYNNGS